MWFTSAWFLFLFFNDKMVVGHVASKIRDGDVLHTYESSCVVEMILLYAHDLGK